MASQSYCPKDHNIEGLFKCPWFYSELSRDDATEILNEAVKNDGESWRDIIFLETVSDDIGQNRFTITIGTRVKNPNDIQPRIYFRAHGNGMYYCILDNDFNWRRVVRKNPFSLEVLAAVKVVASCGFNLETLGLPKMIKEEVSKYQDLNERIKSSEYRQY